MRYLSVIFWSFLIMGCAPDQTRSKFDLQGHRGCRGLYPENTIPGFLHAIDWGVNTLEMDLVVTKDRQLVVSHEAFMSAEICRDTTETELSDSVQYKYNIYEMTYSQVAQFDCGSKVHPRFPEQKKLAVSKPLLVDVVGSVNKYIKDNQLNPVSYNIEIKSEKETDGVFHPAPKEFSDLAYTTIDGLIPWSRVTIQSFDFRVLQFFHNRYPKVTLALLIENRLTVQENLDSLGFNPDIYSGYFQLLTPLDVKILHSKNIEVIPWTINEKEDMKLMIDMGVDGVITDYPDRFTF